MHMYDGLTYKNYVDMYGCRGVKNIQNLVYVAFVWPLRLLSLLHISGIFNSDKNVNMKQSIFDSKSVC